MSDRVETIVYGLQGVRKYSKDGHYAMFRLAQCHENGDGLEKDLSRAYEFYLLADIYHN